MNLRAPGIRLTSLPSERAKGGAPLALTGRVLSFSFEASNDKADKVSMELENGDLALFEGDILLGGALLEITWGYPGWTAPPRRVVLKRLSGLRTLRVEGFALSTLLDQVVKTRRWENVRPSDVAKILARENGYPDAAARITDSGERVDVLAQSAETDAQLLRRLAAKQNFEFRIDHEGFTWGPRRRDTAPVRTLVYGSPEVLSLEPSMDLRGQAGGVEARGRDPLDKKTIARNANGETTKRTTLAERVEVVDPETGKTTIERRNATKAVRPSSAASQAKLTEETDASFAAGEASALKITVECAGNPDLDARQIVELAGVPAFLAGRYAISECRHQIGSGYTTSLTLERDGVGGAKTGTGATAEQKGEKNRTKPPSTGLELRERVDAESGASWLAFFAKKPSDPEAKR
jgi:phage protein D